MHPGSRISQVYLCRAPVDFRKQIDGLAALVEQDLGMSPFADAVYVFINRYRTKMKILYWHRNGRSRSAGVPERRTHRPQIVITLTDGESE